MRSSTASVLNPAASARRAHSTIPSRSTPGTAKGYARRMRKLAVTLVVLVAGMVAGTAYAQQERCGQLKANEKCHEGGGKRAAGGGEKVSHKGWPAITGIYWQVEDGHNGRHTGTEDNDELLGHSGSDTISGGAGSDVIWGDWEPNNPSGQTDVMYG